MNPPAAPFLELRRASLARVGHEDGAAVHELSCGVESGKLTVVTGDEAAGKSAVFRLVGLLATPTSGEVLVSGKSTAAWSDEARTEYRTQHVGYIFAAPFLLPSLTAIENVAMPVLKRTHAPAEAVRDTVERLFTLVGMAGHEQRTAGELSFAEQYRVAIARALAHEPEILALEEFDRTLAGEELASIAALLHAIAAAQQLAIVATASPAFPVRLADVILPLQAGQLVPVSAPLS